ncbi:hypothetical protein [Sorangium sp. So ce590]
MLRQQRPRQRRRRSFTDLLQELIDRGADVQGIDVYKRWLEVDRRAWALI